LQPYLLLDAGGTLLFPDFRLLRQLIRQRGTDVEEERLRRIATEYIKRYDESLQYPEARLDFSDFLHNLLERAGVQSAHIPALLGELHRLDKERSLWSATFPWVREALQCLSTQGYRMSVISNADGRVHQELEYLGLDKHFEQIFDSHIVGYEKPDVRLFQHALQQLGLAPAQCLYVGDVYFVDVLGANRSGIAAVHLDQYDLYAGWKGRHIRNIAALPDLLATPDLDLTSEDFFPLRAERQ